MGILYGEYMTLFHLDFVLHFYSFMLITIVTFPFLCYYPSSTNTNDYPEAFHNIVDSEGNHVYLFDTSEECKSFFTKHNIPPEIIKIVNVCDSNCCSYMEEQGITQTHHCQEDCSAAETDQTAPDSDVIECEKASRYYHPPVDMSRPYW